MKQGTSATLLLVLIGCVLQSVALLCDGNASNYTTLYMGGLQLYSSAPNPSYPDHIDFQGLRLQLNATNGVLQIIEISNGNMVWAWGLSGQTCTGGTSGRCNIVYQGDGNLVIYYPNGNAIGTSTYGKNAAAMVFTTSPPYFTMLNSSCAQIWPTATNKPTLGPLPRTTPVKGPTFDVASAAVQALPASAWKSHFGVNTHCSQGWSSAMVYNLTTYVGTGIIRDSLPTTSQAPDYVKMFNKGIRLNVVAGGAPNKTMLTKQVQAWSTYQTTLPGMLIQIEGFNEINNFGFVYNGFDYTKTSQGMAQAMSDLYSLVKSTPNLANVTVLDLTGGAFSDGAKWNLTNYVGHADVGTMHPYPGRGVPCVSIAGTSCYYSDLGGSYSTNWRPPMSNFAVTETGYHTDTFQNGVTETAQSILVVNELLGGVAVGLRQVFIYELIDEYWDGYNGSESHFGLFRHDKSPKPAARALHFLSQLLSDVTTSFNAAQLTFSMQGLPVGSQYLLFQNTSNTFFLVVWNNVPVYNDQTQSDIPFTPLQVTLTLSSSMSVSLYDVYSTTANDSIPLPPTTTTVGTTMQFMMGNKAVVLSLTTGLS